MRKTMLLSLAVLLVHGASGAAAQETATATLNVAEVLSLSLNSNSVNFPVPTATEFNSGFVAASNSITVTGGGNANYGITWVASGNGTSLTAGAYLGETGRNNKPLAHLRYSTSAALGSSTDGATVPTSSTSLATGTAGSTTSTSVYFGMVLAWADTPGSYSADLTYTISAQ